MTPKVVAVLKGRSNSNSIDAPLTISMSKTITNSISGGHSNFRGSNSGVKLGEGLGGSTARVRLIDSITRRSLMTPQVVAVLKGGSNSNSIDAPLAIPMSKTISNSISGGHSNFRGNNSRVKLGERLCGSTTWMRLVDSIPRRSLMTPKVVAVLQGGSNSNSIDAPLSISMSKTIPNSISGSHSHFRGNNSRVELGEGL